MARRQSASRAIVTAELKALGVEFKHGEPSPGPFTENEILRACMQWNPYVVTVGTDEQGPYATTRKSYPEKTLSNGQVIAAYNADDYYIAGESEVHAAMALLLLGLQTGLFQTRDMGWKSAAANKAAENVPST